MTIVFSSNINLRQSTLFSSLQNNHASHAITISVKIAIQPVTAPHPLLQ